MPFLSFFADEQDSELLLNWLNAEKEIAFIVQDQLYEEQQLDVTEPEYEVRFEPLDGLFSFSQSHLDNQQGTELDEAIRNA